MVLAADVTRPVSVYLDTSAWSEIEKRGPDDAAVRLLGALGACHSVVYIASLETMEEVPADQPWTGKRLAAMKALSGTVLMDTTALDLFRYEGAALAACAGGAHPIPQVSIDVHPLATISDADLIARVRAFRVVRPFRRIFAAAERTSRRASHWKTKANLQAEERQTARLLTGDIEKMNLGLIGGTLLKAAQPILTTAVDRVVRAGLIAPPATKFDRQFGLAVLPHLPDNVRRDPEQVTRIHELWTSSRAFEFAPAMVCAAAVADVFRFDTKRKYESSEGLDRLHAAYMPYVDVFTCDKRTRDTLERTKRVGSGALCATIARAAPLAHVVSAVAKVATRRFRVTTLPDDSRALKQ